MDINQPLDHGTVDQLRFDTQSLDYLAETARWAKFIAIVGFVFIGLMIIAAFLMGTFMSTMADSSPELAVFPSSFFTIMYLAMALIYIFPVLYLYRFATKMQIAIKSQDQHFLQSSFASLKSHYKFIGILLLIIIGFYALAILFALIGGAASTFM